MTKSFVKPNPATQTPTTLRPSTREEIRELARAAGLDLPEALMNELCDAYPAFEAMVRRLPARGLAPTSPARRRCRAPGCLGGPDQAG